MRATSRIRTDIAVPRDNAGWHGADDARRRRRPGLRARPYAGSAQALFDRGVLAVQLNVGPMVVPTTKAEYIGGRVPMPPKLFSHNDQQSYWQGLAPEGASSGWAGRMADLFAAGNGNSTFANVTAGGTALLLSGRHVSAYRVSPAGSTPIELLQRDTYGSTACTDLLRTLLTRPGAPSVPAADHRHAGAVDPRRCAIARRAGRRRRAWPVRCARWAPQLKIVARADRRAPGAGGESAPGVLRIAERLTIDNLNGARPVRELGGALARFPARPRPWRWAWRIA